MIMMEKILFPIITKEIEIAPMPGGSLTSVMASYNSPYGLISSSWKLENDQFLLEVTIPPYTTATVIVPGDTQKDLSINGQNINEREGIKRLEKTEQSFILSVDAGSYSFFSHFSNNKK